MKKNCVDCLELRVRIPVRKHKEDPMKNAFQYWRGVMFCRRGVLRNKKGDVKMFSLRGFEAWGEYKAFKEAERCPYFTEDI